MKEDGPRSASNLLAALWAWLLSANPILLGAVTYLFVLALHAWVTDYSPESKTVVLKLGPNLDLRLSAPAYLTRDGEYSSGQIFLVLEPARNISTFAVPGVAGPLTQTLGSTGLSVTLPMSVANPIVSAVVSSSSMPGVSSTLTQLTVSVSISTMANFGGPNAAMSSGGSSSPSLTTSIPSVLSSSAPTCTSRLSNAAVDISTSLRLKLEAAPMGAVVFTAKDGAAESPDYELQPQSERDRRSIFIKNTGATVGADKVAIFVEINGLKRCSDDTAQGIQLDLEDGTRARIRRFLTALFGAGGPLFGVATAFGAWLFQRRREEIAGKPKELRSAFRRRFSGLGIGPSVEVLALLARDYVNGGAEDDASLRHAHLMAAKGLAQLIVSEARNNLQAVVEQKTAMAKIALDLTSAGNDFEDIDAFADLCMAISGLSEWKKSKKEGLGIRTGFNYPYWAGVYLNYAINEPDDTFRPATDSALGTIRIPSDANIREFLSGVIASEKAKGIDRGTRTFYSSLFSSREPAPIEPSTSGIRDDSVWSWNGFLAKNLDTKHVDKVQQVIREEAARKIEKENAAIADPKRKSWSKRFYAECVRISNVIRKAATEVFVKRAAAVADAEQDSWSEIFHGECVRICAEWGKTTQAPPARTTT